MKRLTYLLLLVATIVSVSVGSLAHADALSLGYATLRVGSVGQYVVNLQEELNIYNGASLTADGTFGPKTKSAVQAFQQSHGLYPDGLVGNATKQAIATLTGGTPVSTACTAVPITSFSDGIPQTSMQIPTLQVTGPVAGGTYYVGDTINVTWNNCTSFQGNVSVSLVAAGGQSVAIANNIPASSLQYSFVIASNDLVSGVASSTYTVVVSTGLLSDSNIGQSSSGAFTIAANSSSSAPFLTLMQPTSGPIGTTVDLYGNNLFSTNGDTVLFAGGPVTANLINGGTLLTFTVPNSVGADCQAGSVCPMYERLITAGTYPVSVRTSAGTSKPLTFTVTGGSQLVY